MKYIGVTQRVDYISGYDEWRDGIDRCWYALLRELKCLPVPLPNIPNDGLRRYLDRLSLDGVIFTGGNSIAFGKEAVEGSCNVRDDFEKAVIEWAVNGRIPILGVCRGMQIINLYFGGDIIETDDHKALYHDVNFSKEVNKYFGRTRKVNSYHTMSIRENMLGDELCSLGVCTNDKTVELFGHRKKIIFGMMWHPERENSFYEGDIMFLRDIFT